MAVQLFKKELGDLCVNDTSKEDKFDRNVYIAAFHWRLMGIFNKEIFEKMIELSRKKKSNAQFSYIPLVFLRRNDKQSEPCKARKDPFQLYTSLASEVKCHWHYLKFISKLEERILASQQNDTSRSELWMFPADIVQQDGTTTGGE